MSLDPDAIPKRVSGVFAFPWLRSAPAGGTLETVDYADDVEVFGPVVDET